jgi:hypothetical protein
MDRSLVSAGEQAGLDVEQMTQILDAGFSILDLMQLIGHRLQSIEGRAKPSIARGWIM